MQLLIDGMTVTVIRKPIKNMNLRVLPPDGVIQITAPARLPQENIARFVREKRSWIERRQPNSCRAPGAHMPGFFRRTDRLSLGRKPPSSSGTSCAGTKRLPSRSGHRSAGPSGRYARTAAGASEQLLPRTAGRTDSRVPAVLGRKNRTSSCECSDQKHENPLGYLQHRGKAHLAESAACQASRLSASIMYLAHELTHLLHPDHGNGLLGVSPARHAGLQSHPKSA